MSLSAAQLHQRRDLLLPRGVYRIDAACAQYRMFLLVTTDGRLTVHSITTRDRFDDDVHAFLRDALQLMDPRPEVLSDARRPLPTVPADVVARLIATEQLDPATVIVPPVVMPAGATSPMRSSTRLVLHSRRPQ